MNYLVCVKSSHSLRFCFFAEFAPVNMRYQSSGDVYKLVNTSDLLVCLYIINGDNMGLLRADADQCTSFLRLQQFSLNLVH